MLLTSFDVEELVREHAQARLAEAERERLVAQVPSPPHRWHAARRALVRRLTRGDACTEPS